MVPILSIYIYVIFLRLEHKHIDFLVVLLQIKNKNQLASMQIPEQRK